MSPILSHILSKLQENTIVYPFVILHGSGVDNQRWSLVQSCQEACGFFAYHDVLEIKDYSKILGKPHTLKVEYKKTDDTDLLLKDHQYEDKWSREINDWLSYAPSGDSKVLLIEHIDRATIGATNALLKSLEEPLPHRIIIASTKNKDLILPTILSRALLIHCDAPYEASPMSEDLQKIFADTIIALEKKDIAVLSKSASQIAKWAYTKVFLDNLIAHYNVAKQYHQISPCISAITMISSNVSAEHTLFSLFLELMK